MTKKELEEIRDKKSLDMAEKKWVIGQQSVYKNGFKDGFNACADLLLPIIKDYEEVLECMLEYADNFICDREHENCDDSCTKKYYEDEFFKDLTKAREVLKKH